MKTTFESNLTWKNLEQELQAPNQTDKKFHEFKFSNLIKGSLCSKEIFFFTDV